MEGGISMKNQISFNCDICLKCGICGEICPNKIIVKNREGMTVFQDREQLCFQCGQCMSVCPTSAIFVSGLSYEEDFCDIPEKGEYEKAFFDMILSRRSVRNFKDKPVPKEMLERIINSLSYAPIAFPPVKTEVIVIQNPNDIKRALPYFIELYDYLYQAFQNPIKRFFIKRNVGEKKYMQMQNHLIPLLKVRLPGLKNGTEDTITRHAPAMLLFHTDKKGEDINVDLSIAVTYCIIAAHAMGLGATIMDIIPPAINKKKELREIFGVPDDHEVIASIILGFPKYNYLRGIKRRLKSVRWI
jgi:nitroreductase/NAD-dependent dihydropyrimidine dehydrogenase PreA subunit